MSILSLEEQIDTIFKGATTPQRTMLYKYVENICLGTDNTNNPLRENIRKEERNKYMRNRYAEKPELRTKHQKHMRDYRLRKKQEIEKLKELVASQKNP
tara:strand:+ start:127 stop:423 length:297 start_codon:yes stop_codon:yes gene_type:complete